MEHSQVKTFNENVYMYRIFVFFIMSDADKYLGVSSCTDNKFDNDFVRKQGARSSSTRSP